MNKPMELAVDARVVAQDTRGIGRYERAILRRLASRDDIRLTLLQFGPFASRHRRTLERALGSNRFVIASRVSARHDLVWHPANGTFFPSSRPSVVTVHDAVPFRYPDADLKTRARVQRPFLASVRAASHVIAVSEFGKSELRDVFGLPDDRISVIYHGVDASFEPGHAAPLPYGLEPQRYLLFVGDPIGEPRKNFGMLYDAYRRAWPAGDGPALVIAGPRAPELPGIVHAGELGEDLTGSGNPRLCALYRGALALALASYHETFGMPVLEAMACGTPVIASRASCLPEIGGDAALYVPFDDAAAWAQMLLHINGDASLRGSLSAAGIDRARAFDWERSTALHIALFARVAG